MRACSSSALSCRTRSAEPAPWLSTLWICARRSRIRALQVVLLGLELVGRLDQRRPLLGRVPDPRTLGRELGGDQEAERQERDAEGDLPARDRPDPDPSRSSRVAARAAPATERPRAAPSPTTPIADRDEPEDEPARTCRRRSPERWHRGRATGRRGPVPPARPARPTRPRHRAPPRSTPTGPDRRAPAAVRTSASASALTLLNQAVAEGRHVEPERRP